MGIGEEFACATITGRLENARMTYLPAAKTKLAEARLAGVPIVAEEAIAEQLANILRGSLVRVTANIVLQQWKTGEGKSREKLELHATEVEVLERPRPL